MSEVIIQEAEFKSGEYGELVVVGQPLIDSGVFFDFYPKGVYGEPKEAQHRETGPPFVPPLTGGGQPDAVVVLPSMKGTNAPEPRREEGGEDPEPEGLAESFAEPRMVLYCSNSPRDGWKRIGEFKAHIYTEQARKMCFYRIIHPVGCPFEGKVVVAGKAI